MSFNNLKIKIALCLLVLSVTIVFVNAQMTPEEVFTKAESMFDDGEWVKSMTLYEEVYLKFPDSDIADDALFMKGMIEMRLEMFDDAIITFKLLQNEYPESNRFNNSQNDVDIILGMRNRDEVIQEVMENITARLNVTQSSELAELDVEPVFEKKALDVEQENGFSWGWVVASVFLGIILYLVLHEIVVKEGHRRRRKRLSSSVRHKKH